MNTLDAADITSSIEAQNRRATLLTPAEFWLRANQKLDQLETENPSVLFVSIPELPLTETETVAIDIQSLGHPILATAIEVASAKAGCRHNANGMEISQFEFSDGREPRVPQSISPTNQVANHLTSPLNKQPAPGILPEPEIAEVETIPSMPAEQSNWESANHWSLANRSVDFSGLELSLMQSSRSSFEDFKKFRDLRGQILLICDTESSTTADLAAYSVMKDLIERFNEPVLFIDAQLDRTGVSEVLGVESTEGWAEIVKLEKPWQTAILPSNLPRAYFLSTGVVKLRTQTAGNFFAPRMQRLAQELQNNFRFVVVSCGTAFDSGILAWARYCDHAYLTADPATASRSMTKAAVEQMRVANARVAGIVVAQQPQVA